MRQLRALAIFEQDETRWRCRRPREAIDETGDDRIWQYAVVLSAASGMSTPIRRIGSDCYARAASGRAVPPSSVMNLAPIAGGTRFASRLPGVATPAIPQGYRYHQETAFQFPCPVELHSARYPGPLSN